MTDIQKLVLEQEPGSDIIDILSLLVNASPLASFREAASNSYDAKSKRVDITVSKDLIMIEDWGTGITDIKEFVKYGLYSKVKMGKKVIGRMHIGKLSLLKLGKMVQYLTNDGKQGYNITLTKEKTVPAEKGDADAFLDHTGTLVRILEPYNNPEIFTGLLHDYLQDAFTLLIKRGFSVRLNGIKIQPNPAVDSEEPLKLKFADKFGITGNIKPGGNGTLDVYCRYVKIANIPIDTQRDFGGWVNCDDLIPTAARNEVQNDEIFRAFKDALKEYCQQFKKRETEESDRRLTRIKNNLDDLMREYIKMFQIMPKTKGEGSVQQVIEQRESPQNETGTIEPTDTHKERTPRKQKHIGSGIITYESDLGNVMPPMVFESPNIIHYNVSNDLFRLCIKKQDKPKYGTAEVRLLPFVSRVVIQLRKEYDNWTADERIMESDNAMKWFLQTMMRMDEGS